MLTKRKFYHPMYSHLMNKYHSKDYSSCEPTHHTHFNKTQPSVNIIETEDKFEMSIAAPGKSKKDFNIKVENDLLTISAVEKEEKVDETIKYSRREYNFDSFERSFRLPKDVVDINNIEAKYDNGELFITIPKKEEAKDLPPKDIEIK